MKIKTLVLTIARVVMRHLKYVGRDGVTQFALLDVCR